MVDSGSKLSLVFPVLKGVTLLADTQVPEHGIRHRAPR